MSFAVEACGLGKTRRSDSHHQLCCILYGKILDFSPLWTFLLGFLILSVFQIANNYVSAYQNGAFFCLKPSCHSPKSRSLHQEREKQRRCYYISWMKGRKKTNMFCPKPWIVSDEPSSSVCFGYHKQITVNMPATVLNIETFCPFKPFNDQVLSC